jgi:hypothetical protein
MLRQSGDASLKFLQERVFKLMTQFNVNVIKDFSPDNNEKSMVYGAGNLLYLIQSTISSIHIDALANSVFECLQAQLAELFDTVKISVRYQNCDDMPRFTDAFIGRDKVTKFQSIYVHMDCILKLIT